jgi:hypothetical protein
MPHPAHAFRRPPADQQDLVDSGGAKRGELPLENCVVADAKGGFQSSVEPSSSTADQDSGGDVTHVLTAALRPALRSSAAGTSAAGPVLQGLVVRYQNPQP